MSCTQIASAMDWAMKSKGNDQFPVTAFVPRHQGVLTKPDDPSSKGLDFCSYATGPVTYRGTSKPYRRCRPPGRDPHSIRKLEFADGVASSECGVERANLRDGTVIFQDYVYGKPIPFAQTVKATCVGGVLLTGTYNNGVIVVGVRREPEENLK